MSQNLTVAYAAPTKSQQSESRGAAALKLKLGALWVAQTLQDMLIIGLTSAEIGDVVGDVLQHWCRDVRPTDASSIQL